MLSSEHMQTLMAKIIEHLNKVNINCDGGQGNRKPVLTPSQILVITGMLGNVLFVESVLIDKQQTVQIVLTGSLKRKTEMDKMLDQIGSMSFEDVMKAIIEHFS